MLHNIVTLHQIVLVKVLAFFEKSVYAEILAEFTNKLISGKNIILFTERVFLLEKIF